MADFKYQRDTNRFFALGMDLNRPGDGLKELKYRVLKNVRSYQTGRIEPRQGLTLIGIVNGEVHSIRRLNNPRTNSWTRIIGSGTILSAGRDSFAAIDTGYSGDPLALVPYRPSQSPDPWMYVMDRLKQRKVDVSGNIHQIGMPAPTTPPVVTRQATYHKDIFSPNMSLTGWNNGPTFVATFPEANQNVNTSVSTVLYDSGSTGWCLIEPGIMNGISTGMHVAIGTGTYVVRDAITGSTNYTDIASSELMSDGVTQSVTFTTITNGLKPNSLLENVSKSEFVRVQAVVDGPSGDQCVIIEPPTPWSVGDDVYIRDSFRIYTTVTIAPGTSITETSLSVYVNVTSDSTKSYTGWMNSPKFNPPLDLSKITDDISSTPDSYVAISMSLERPDDVDNIRVMFGCTDTNDPDEAFNTNYFFKVFTPSDLSGVAPEEDSAVTTKSSIKEGASTLRIKLAELLPVGSPSLKSIYYMRIEMTVRTPETEKEFPGSRIYFGSIYLAGTPGPDRGIFGVDYIYRYRARSTTTGVVSNWSPATVESYDLQGESVLVSAPSQYTLSAEADMIDFQRRGGSIPNDWYYIGSVANSSPVTTFTDEYSDDVVIANPSEGQDHYQLWPTIGVPTSGTVTSTSGVMVVGTGFSTSWAPLTPILIDGTWYTIYQVYSETLLQLYENTGSLTAVTWEVPEPILQGQSMPCFWGPLQETMFACGDLNNPQRLYWTNIGEADATQLKNWIDITTPSEPLMNGVIYNGRSYVWSSGRFFQIIPAEQDENGVVTRWAYVEIPDGKGLWARWAFTNPQSIPGPVLYFLGKDAVYQTDGGTPSDVTAEDLRPLMPNEGNLGEDVNGIIAPNMIESLHAGFRLSYYDDYLYFDYPSATSGGGAASVLALTPTFSDDLNNWTDTLRSNNMVSEFVDAMPVMEDSFEITLTTYPFSFTDSLDTWADTFDAGAV
jgi:hypothetical protein